jgi:hypothetical protein
MVRMIFERSFRIELSRRSNSLLVILLAHADCSITLITLPRGFLALPFPQHQPLVDRKALPLNVVT